MRGARVPPTAGSPVDGTPRVVGLRLAIGIGAQASSAGAWAPAWRASDAGDESVETGDSRPCTRVPAFVRWVRDGRVGLNFTRALPPALLAQYGGNDG